MYRDKHQGMYTMIAPGNTACQGKHPVCCLTTQAVAKLAEAGVKLIAMRCAGYDRVDLEACEAHGIKVVRVPTYSPTSVAEHEVGLLLALNRCGHQIYMRGNAQH
jgi:D-lactate dehydrogenase